MTTEEKASQRQIAGTLGVDEKTVRRDVAADAAVTPDDASENDDSGPSSAANAAPTLSGAEAAKAAEKAERKAAAAEETKARRDASRTWTPPRHPAGFFFALFCGAPAAACKGNRATPG